MYVSQDPIGLAGGMVAYGYVRDVNSGVDVWGLIECNLDNLNPKKVHFMQSSAKNKTGDYTVLENAIGLKNSTIDPKILTIRVWEDADDKVWSIDHRRLAAFKKAGLENMPVKWASPDEIAKNMWKMTTKNGGKSIRLKLENGESQIIE